MSCQDSKCLCTDAFLSIRWPIRFILISKTIQGTHLSYNWELIPFELLYWRKCHSPEGVIGSKMSLEPYFCCLHTYSECDEYSILTINKSFFLSTSLSLTSPLTGLAPQTPPAKVTLAFGASSLTATNRIQWLQFHHVWWSIYWKERLHLICPVCAGETVLICKIRDAHSGNVEQIIQSFGSWKVVRIL